MFRVMIFSSRIEGKHVVYFWYIYFTLVSCVLFYRGFRRNISLGYAVAESLW